MIFVSFVILSFSGLTFLLILNDFRTLKGPCVIDSKTYHNIADRQTLRSEEEFLESVINFDVSQIYPYSDVNPDRYLIYTCSKSLGYAKCGGWADRQKSIVSAYIMSILSNRTFAIMDDMPCDFSNYYDENYVKWKISSSEIRGLSRQTFSTTKRDIHPGYIPALNMERDLHADVVHYHGNWDFVEEWAGRLDTADKIPWTVQLPRADVYKLILSSLLKPTSDFKQTIQQFYRDQVQGRSLICAHIRWGRNPTIPNDGTTGLNSTHVDTVLEFLSRYKNDSYRIFVATDSNEILSKADKVLGRYRVEMPGPITHMDLTRGDNQCIGQRKSLLEHRILSQCDTVVLTRSGFGITAAYMRRNSQNLYCLYNHHVIPCSRYKLTFVYPMSMSPWLR
ncbi:hypothetical protein FSP39_016768 [Pinctada imbricata]|uniref:Uncharacterized protein n=1 Tax=Pinctada imbricata TaxID=66713 RepID=A0AA88XFW9_PINIB|nr:hypothetical protein FSP39_016768 [Pinctada imbricata]